ncbi:hypothetical protein BBD33_08140 [Elizabethkingia meningoseptica]|uniref:hypothetical protein n=1 Tax=Elizabethkingia meningoseptica TaxID=238 RepID=UPI000332CA37|nr:hypothetical protein [Elizabethkingia meningoseptica]AQX05216.1 hypothetical protein BBD33_08140 [Elizabethkingia meningoseptica]AQX47261.1 hypothetical protein B5G46_08130 [Elizabethkingia meningoseptica]EOR29088.1 hypothetical protein L100_12873 [Elizabethkingia meningoseptica ATCC 13253 = NBRC 12535]MDE5489330.1 fimbrillin family protein [Elizabethkingia meningoseptica]MVW93698.1 fimbrillin family protein [Elizabethkingia meningoseptica]
MNLNLLKHRKTLLIVVSLWTISCRSTDNPIQEENQNAYNVKINMLGIIDAEQAPATSASANKSVSSSQAVQNSTIKIDENNYVTASLIPQNATSNNRAQASINPMAATPVNTFLGNQVKYKVVVYDSNGAWKAEKEFSYTQNDSDGFMLDGGQNYTFIAYSVNSTSSTDTPAVSSGGTLATATLANVNKDLMFFKKNMTVTGNGPNYLDVVLKHQFSQITTILDARQVGTITSIVSPTISPAKSSANLSFNNSTLSYNSDISGGAVISFPTPNSQYVSGTPTQIISPTNANGELKVGALTLDGITKNNVTLSSKVKIDPGVKYDLRLRFGPCRQDVTPTPFRVNNGDSKTFNMPATSFGFVFDIYFLDNSFNMTINGTKLATTEIQFQDNIGGSPQNVAFADNSGTYEHNYPGIWTYDGNAINGNSTAVPIVRVVISPDGTVSMYGVKQNRGPLYPLKLVNGNSFNKVPWNTGSSNTVIASQQIFNSTTMNGIGTGKTIITCANP